MPQTKLDSDQSFKDATSGELQHVCNGCGSTQAKFDFVPDTIYGLSITEACKVHDWDYHIGATIEHKGVADRRFLNNMLRLIEPGNRFLKPFRRRRAKKYYLAVKYFGGVAYWAGKNV